MISELTAILTKLSFAIGLLSTALAAVPGSTYVITPEPVPDTTWAGYEQLKRIAACESVGDPEGTPRQFNKDGSILWGRDPKLWNINKATTTDVGILQINTTIHAAELKKLGLDVIHSESDNIKFGKILYDRQGTKPWNPSKKCWGPGTT